MAFFNIIEEGTGNAGKYEKLLEVKRQRWQDKNSEFKNDLIKQKDVRRIWEAVRSTVKKRAYNMPM
jgi:hypothetical protein